MPASSVGVMNSWGIYLIASAALVAALTPQLIGASQDSREACDYRMADGIRSVLDSLRSGTVVTFSFSGWPTPDSAHLTGHAIVFTGANWTVTARTRYSLPNVTLSPGVNYQVWLQGSSVRVSEHG